MNKPEPGSIEDLFRVARSVILILLASATLVAILALCGVPSPF